MIGEDQQSDLAVEEQGSLGQVLKGPDTVSGFCKKDYTSQHLRGTGTAIFYFILFFEEYIFEGGGGHFCRLFCRLPGTISCLGDECVYIFVLSCEGRSNIY